MIDVRRVSQMFWRQVEQRARVLLRLGRRLLGRARFRKDGEPRLLMLREQISVGEKRTVAIVDCGQERYLVGCTAQSINLLAKLPPPRDFTDCLADHYEMANVQ